MVVGTMYIKTVKYLKHLIPIENIYINENRITQASYKSNICEIHRINNFVLFYSDMDALRNIMILRAFLEENEEAADDEELVCIHLAKCIIHANVSIHAFRDFCET